MNKKGFTEGRETSLFIQNMYNPIEQFENTRDTAGGDFGEHVNNLRGTMFYVCQVRTPHIIQYSYVDTRQHVIFNDILKSLKGQCHEIFCFRFFMNHLPPEPLKMMLG
jgi:hypothetical protein